MMLHRARYSLFSGGPDRGTTMVDYIGVSDSERIVNALGPAEFMARLAGEIEADYRRWPEFEKAPRLASHSPVGVIELMPATDGKLYSFKYVNGHPKNTAAGLLTVTAFGVLADVIYTRRDTDSNRVYVSGWPGGNYAPCQLTAACTAGATTSKSAEPASRLRKALVLYIIKATQVSIPKNTPQQQPYCIRR